MYMIYLKISIRDSLIHRAMKIITLCNFTVKIVKRSEFNYSRNKVTFNICFICSLMWWRHLNRA